MQPHEQEQKLTQTPQQAAQRRFQIEKLEERIAPAKGGTPGKPPDYTCYGDCHPGNGRHHPGGRP
jgi:hypothetical protein